MTCQWPGSIACNSYVGSWTMTILTFLVDVSRHLPPGTQRSRSPRRSGPRLSLVLCGLLQKSPASLPPRWNISMLACLDKTRQVYFRIDYIHTLLDHRCWRLPPFRVSGSRTRQARMSSKICSGSRNSRKGSPASRVSPNRLLDHPLTLIPFRRRRTAFDGLGDRRQCEHPLGEQRPTGGVGMQALD